LVRVHDAIEGVLYLISLGLTLFTTNLIFLWIAVAMLQFISPMTKFCPVYFVLNNLMLNTNRSQ